MAAPKNLHRLTLGAGPRAADPRQLTLFAVPEDAADTAATVHAAVRGRAPWIDTAGSHASTATAEPIGNRLHCNNAFADAAARTAVRIP